jgi:hypothetical protein
MDGARLKSAAKRVKDGVRIVGTLLAAAAVMRVVARAAQLPVGDWLASILALYADLLHPIVHYTIGLVPAAFGYELLPVTKDVLILYGLFAGSLYRSLHGDGETPPEPKGRMWKVQAALAWPLVLLLFLAAAKALYVNRERDWMAEAFVQQGLFTFLRELGFVLLIVAACLLLNAAGILKMPG